MNRRLGRLPPWAVRGFFWLLTASPLWAAEEGVGSPVNTSVGWVFRWLNFILVFGGLGYLLATRAPAFFRRRANAIAEAIAEGARARAEAERVRKEAEARLAALPRQTAALRAEAQRDAAAEVERIRTLARQEAEKIEHAAQTEIQAAARAARLELKALAARLAVERAETLLRKELTPQADAALFRGFVAALEGSVN